MKRFRIKNWNKYQHRDHKKGMPWIKLHTELLDNEKMHELSTYQVGVWCKLMLTCARVGNDLPANQSYLKSKLNLSKPMDLALFMSLGLIEEMPARSERVDDAVKPLLDRDREEIKNKTNLRYAQVSVNSTKSSRPKTPSILSIWNENCGTLPHIKTVSPKRQKAWVARFKEQPEEAYWIGVFQRISKSDFCIGKNNRNWIATIDFALRPDTHIKALEGLYDNRDASSQEDMEAYFKRKGLI